MLDDPPILKIRRDFPRPTEAQIKALTGAMTGHAVDAMDGRGALEPRIEALEPGNAAFTGTIVTAHAYPADNVGLLATLDVVRPGDVVVCSTDAFIKTAVTGDLVVGMLKNAGVAGLVTDGAVRDVAGIVPWGLPVFCAGVTPNSPARNGPGSVGLPVVIGDVNVESGDIAVADRDGVVIVPRALADAVIARIAEIKAAEAEVEAKVKAGLVKPPFLEALLNSGRVTEVD